MRNCINVRNWRKCSNCIKCIVNQKLPIFHHFGLRISYGVTWHYPCESMRKGISLYESTLKPVHGNMEVSDVLIGVTIITPTCSSKAFQGQLLSGCAKSHTLQKGGEGMRKRKPNRSCPHCRCWWAHREWTGYLGHGDLVSGIGASLRTYYATWINFCQSIRKLIALVVVNS